MTVVSCDSNIISYSCDISERWYSCGIRSSIDSNVSFGINYSSDSSDSFDSCDGNDSGGSCERSDTGPLRPTIIDSKTEVAVVTHAIPSQLGASGHLKYVMPLV